MSDLQTIGWAILTSTAISGLLSFVVTTFVSKRIELAYTKRQFRFTTLHEKMAETIEGAYARLQSIHIAVWDYVKEMKPGRPPTTDEQRGQIAKRIKDFEEYFIPRQIYLPEKLAARINELKSSFHNTTMQLSYSECQPDPNKALDKYSELTYKLEKDLVEILRGLEREMRDLLGFSS